MVSELFESIIRTSGADTDDFYEDPSVPIALSGTLVDLFEAVLAEGVLSVKSKNDNSVTREPKSGLPYLSQYASKIIDVFDRLRRNDPTARADNNTFMMNLPNFYVADIVPLNRKVNKVRPSFSIKGDYFAISYKMLREHYKKDAGHEYTHEILKELCQKITDPFLISQHFDKKAKKWTFNLLKIRKPRPMAVVMY
jgi:hypothetical protein